MRGARAGGTRDVLLPSAASEDGIGIGDYSEGGDFPVLCKSECLLCCFIIL